MTSNDYACGGVNENCEHFEMGRCVYDGTCPLQLDMQTEKSKVLYSFMRAITEKQEEIYNQNLEILQRLSKLGKQR